MRRWGRVTATLLGAVTLFLGGSASASPAPEAEPQAAFTVYLAPTSAGGSDANDGLTPATAVNTLVRVQGVLRQHRPATDVEVRIRQGTYVAPPFHDWRFYVPGHSISFLPIDYVPGAGFPAGGLPVFRNAKCGSIYCNGFWLQPRLPRETTDPLYDGGNSGLRFYYLQVEYYSAGGISIYGDSERDVEDERYDPPLQVRGSQGLNGNTIFGVQFRNLGNKWSLGTYGYGAIVLTNSSNNRIENNHFVNIENAAASAGLIHGAYITHFSSSNTITRNKFSYISGDPIKSRNLSNYNAVENNTFSRTGRISYYRGEFCDRQCAIDNAIPRQCASYGDRFFNNVVQSAYDGGRISNWSLSPEGLTYAGTAPCSIPAGTARIATGGNTS
ncbi:right-handed parallel beta-helix repeat-containing protein [Flindersiella endophytica]